MTWESFTSGPCKRWRTLWQFPCWLTGRSVYLGRLLFTGSLYQISNSICLQSTDQNFGTLLGINIVGVSYLGHFTSTAFILFSRRFPHGWQKSGNHWIWRELKHPWLLFENCHEVTCISWRIRWGTRTPFDNAIFHGGIIGRVLPELGGESDLRQVLALSSIASTANVWDLQHWVCINLHRDDCHDRKNPWLTWMVEDDHFQGL